MRKIYMIPSPAHAAVNTSNAINQIVLKLERYLPGVGYTLTESEVDADLVAVHAGTEIDHCDVAHCHGQYPTANGGNGFEWHANKLVIKNLRIARRVTVPSRWVAEAIARDMRIQTDVVRWAIEHQDWPVSMTNEGFVLWNKSRLDAVCDPTPVARLAEQYPDVPFVTTFMPGGAVPHNVTVIGKQSYESMRDMIRRGGIYLATTKETFGIGTLEAMATGLPVLGYNWGGTAELVRHGVEGYLAEPGDMDGLTRGLRYCQFHRATLSYNARKRALQYSWEKVAQQIGRIYDDLLQPKPKYKVAIIIPCHNYGGLVGAAIQSVLDQQTDFEFQLIVVDDCSTDHSLDAALQALGYGTDTLSSSSFVGTLPTNWLAKTVLHNAENIGVARTRNRGIEHADAEYIVCLDADDRLGSPRFLQVLADALDADPSLGLVYTGIGLVNPEGTIVKTAWPGACDFNQQLAGRNQVPTCNMFRKRAWAAAGGYRYYMEPSEDAELWTRFGLMGWGLKQVLDDPWFIYNIHEGSLSHPVRIREKAEPDWRFFQRVTPTTMPMASIATDPKFPQSWPVRAYDRPVVSIVVAVEEDTGEDWRPTLDSIAGQSFLYWEVILVNTSPSRLDLTAYPFVQEVRIDGSRYAAWNAGLQEARGEFVMFVEPPDYLMPDALLPMEAEARRTERFVYTDWLEDTGEGPEVLTGREFPPNAREFLSLSLNHTFTLFHTAKIADLEGFDETLGDGAEGDVYRRLILKEYCGVHLPGVRFVRPLRNHRDQSPEYAEAYWTPYKPYMEGKMDCGCGGPEKSRSHRSPCGRHDSGRLQRRPCYAYRARACDPDLL